jgi:hypothetical protein
MGYIAVATLIGSGLINSWFLVGAVSRLRTAAYGQMLIAILYYALSAIVRRHRPTDVDLDHGENPQEADSVVRPVVVVRPSIPANGGFHGQR